MGFGTAIAVEMADTKVVAAIASSRAIGEASERNWVANRGRAVADIVNRDCLVAAVGVVNSCRAVAWIADKRLTNWGSRSGIGLAPKDSLPRSNNWALRSLSLRWEQSLVLAMRSKDWWPSAPIVEWWRDRLSDRAHLEPHFEFRQLGVGQP